jgi:hypothetical protein
MAEISAKGSPRLLIPEIWRQHVGYAVLDWIAFLAGLAAKLAGYNFLFILLEYLQREVSFA